MKNTIWTVPITLGLLLSGCASLASVPESQPATTTPVDGTDGTVPIIRVVSPVPASSVARGSGREGAGSEDGSGFALNLEIVTRDDTPITLREATFGAPPENPTAGIRHAELVGQPNPDVPGLTVSVDVDLIKPDGGIIPAHANLASLFNIAGTDDTPGPGVTAWLGWHVLESLPEDVETFTITASITDESGRTSADQASYRVADEWTTGQALTPAPETLEAEATLRSTTYDADGPEVTMIAPRVPTSVAPGPEGTPPAGTGSLHFIQVTAVDRSGAGIGVKEGIVFDPAQIPNPELNGGTAGPNSNYPGLFLAFDVPLRQPNGNLVPAGTNLAPIFDIAGSELDTDGSVRTTADWVVGGSLELPAGKSSVTITARVTDNDGKTGGVTQVVGVSDVEDGQDLTANPAPTAQGTTTEVSLSGAQEVPAVETSATGTATTTLSGSTLTVAGEFSGLSSPVVEVAGSSGHIHQAPAGSNGDVVFPLIVSMTDETSGTFNLSTELSPEQITAYNAGEFYLNFHTETNQGGELRGQILPGM